MKLITKNSPNHYDGRAGWKADMIVCHQTGGNTLSPALNYYMAKNTISPNWLVDTDGTIYQLVNPDNGAWANGTRTNAGDALYHGYSLSEIVRSRKTNANYYTYSIEFVHCLWGNITDAQVTAAVELIQQVIIPHMKKNGVTPQIDRAHVIGHSEVTPKTRDPEKYNCPGKQFPFDEIIKRVNGGRQTTASTNSTTATTTASTKKVTFAFKAVVRALPKKNSAKLGEYLPGQTATIVNGAEKTDPETGYKYVRISGDAERWVVRSAIK